MRYTPMVWTQYSQASKVLDTCSTLEEALSDLRAEGIDTSRDEGAEVAHHQKYGEIEVEHDDMRMGHPRVTYLYYKSI